MKLCRFLSIVLVLALLICSFCTSVSSYAYTDTENGIIAFKNYINNSLPSQYLGNPLSLTPECDAATKVAAIKMVEYKLLSMGNLLLVDGVYTVDDNEIFSNSVGDSVRFNYYGDWAPIVKGLLFCHGYNPGSFASNLMQSDYKYAINQFKNDYNINESNESSDYVRGILTPYAMYFLMWNTEKAVIPEGVYYFKSADTGKYMSYAPMHSQSQSELRQINKYTNVRNPIQLWKISYVGNGRYSIRSLYNTQLALNADDFSLKMTSTGRITDNNNTLDDSYKWEFVLNEDNTVSIVNCADDEDKYIVADSNRLEDLILIQDPDDSECEWIIEKMDQSILSMQLFYDNSFATVHGDNKNGRATEYLVSAILPFLNCFNYGFDYNIGLIPGTLPSDTCAYGYWDTLNVPNAECCNKSVPCSHNTSTNARCKCTYRISDHLYRTQVSDYQFKMCIFAFKTCYGGLGYVNGVSSVVYTPEAMSTSHDMYIYCIRSMQHELTHNFGCHDSSDCTSRCIMNGGFGNINDLNLSCIWCNKCFDSFDINKV